MNAKIRIEEMNAIRRRYEDAARAVIEYAGGSKEAFRKLNAECDEEKKALEDAERKRPEMRYDEYGRRYYNPRTGADGRSTYYVPVHTMRLIVRKVRAKSRKEAIRLAERGEGSLAYAFKETVNAF